MPGNVKREIVAEQRPLCGTLYFRRSAMHFNLLTGIIPLFARSYFDLFGTPAQQDDIPADPRDHGDKDRLHRPRNDNTSPIERARCRHVKAWCVNPSKFSPAETQFINFLCSGGRSTLLTRMIKTGGRRAFDNCIVCAPRSRDAIAKRPDSHAV